MIAVPGGVVAPFIALRWRGASRPGYRTTLRMVPDAAFVQ